MDKLLYIIQKEFIQILRNKAMLPMMTVLPIMQLILLSYAANNEVKNVKIAIVDQSHSTYSRLLIEKVRTSDRFKFVDVPASVKNAIDLMQNGSADIILTIQSNFEKDYIRNKSTDLQLLVNAINGQQATVGAAYVSSIIQSFNNEIRQSIAMYSGNQEAMSISKINVTNSHWYNQELNYKYFMIPGILGEIVTLLVMLLTSMNIVREKEIGTIEQINVTPIKKWQFILGKMIPFLIIGIFLVTIGLIMGKLLFAVPTRGNMVVVFAYCIINITAILGIGLFISNISNTQQQAMFTTFFFGIIFILMSGLFTPIESMPKLAQYLTIPNPIAHFVNVMRSVLLKGSGFSDVAFNFQITFILAVVFNGLAIMSYRKID